MTDQAKIDALHRFLNKTASTEAKQARLDAIEDEKQEGWSHKERLTLKTYKRRTKAQQARLDELEDLRPSLQPEHSSTLNREELDWANRCSDLRDLWLNER